MAMTMMPAGRAALAINMVPPVALAAGWLALGESMTPAQLAACLVVGFGVWLGRRGIGPVQDCGAESNSLGYGPPSKKWRRMASCVPSSFRLRSMAATLGTMCSCRLCR